jgi:oxygen-independent coproporphyrinogen-3 oxidase
MTKHPAAWAQQVDQGFAPVAGSETLSEVEMANENIMLGLRLREGLDLNLLSEKAKAEANSAIGEGLIYSDMFALGRVILTPKGRLLADGLVARLWT